MTVCESSRAASSARLRSPSSGAGRSPARRPPSSWSSPSATLRGCWVPRERPSSWPRATSCVSARRRAGSRTRAARPAHLEDSHMAHVCLAREVSVVADSPSTTACRLERPDERGDPERRCGPDPRRRRSCPRRSRGARLRGPGVRRRRRVLPAGAGEHPRRGDRPRAGPDGVDAAPGDDRAARRSKDAPGDRRGDRVVGRGSGRRDGRLGRGGLEYGRRTRAPRELRLRRCPNRRVPDRPARQPQPDDRRISPPGRRSTSAPPRRFAPPTPTSRTRASTRWRSFR